MAIELKPCPFCGDNQQLNYVELSNGLHYIECARCGAAPHRLGAWDYETAVKYWNTRYLIEYTVKFESEEPRTNGDIIRKMSDDDLGFWKACPVCESCAWFENRECDDDCTKYNCFNGAIAWLKKEAENG